MKKCAINYFPLGRKITKSLLTKKLIILFFAAAMVHVSASVYSQDSKLTFIVTDKPIVEVLAKIEENSDYRFFFQREQINVEKTVTIIANNSSVESILDDLFKRQSVSYKVLEDNLILLYSDSSQSSDSTTGLSSK